MKAEGLAAAVGWWMLLRSSLSGRASLEDCPYQQQLRQDHGGIVVNCALPHSLQGVGRCRTECLSGLQAGLSGGPGPETAICPAGPGGLGGHYRGMPFQTGLTTRGGRD